MGEAEGRGAWKKTSHHVRKTKRDREKFGTTCRDVFLRGKSVGLKKPAKYFLAAAFEAVRGLTKGVLDRRGKKKDDVLMEKGSQQHNLLGKV